MAAKNKSKKQGRTRSSRGIPEIPPIVHHVTPEEYFGPGNVYDETLTEIAYIELRPEMLKKIASDIQSDDDLLAGDEEAWAKVFVRLSAILMRPLRSPSIDLDRLSQVVGCGLGEMAAPEMLTDRNWLERFAHIALGCAQTLREFARLDEHGLSEVAKALPEWPVCLRDSKESATTARKLVQALGVGTADPFDRIKTRGKLTEPIYQWLRALRSGDDQNFGLKLGWPPPDPAKTTVMFYVRQYEKKQPCPPDMTPGVYRHRLEDALDSIFGQYDRLRKGTKGP